MDNLIDWNTKKIQKFITIIILGYFGTKLLYKIYGVNIKVNYLNEEVSNLIQTTVLSLILFFLTKMDSRNLLGKDNVVNYVFIIGYLIGLNGSFIYDNYILDRKGDMDWDKLRKSMYITIIVLVSIIVILNAVLLIVENDSNTYSIEYYLIYLIIIGTIVIGTDIMGSGELIENLKNEEENINIYIEKDLLEKQLEPNNSLTHNSPTDTNNLEYNFNINPIVHNSISEEPTYKNLLNDKNTHEEKMKEQHKIVKYNYRVGLISWFVSLLYVADSNNKISSGINTFLQGLTIGIFVSSFSNKDSVIDKEEEVIHEHNYLETKDKYVMPIGLGITTLLSVITYLRISTYSAPYVFIIGLLITALVSMYLTKKVVLPQPNNNNNMKPNKWNISIDQEFDHINTVYIAYISTWVIGLLIMLTIISKSTGNKKIIVGVAILIMCLISFLLSFLTEKTAPKVSTTKICPYKNQELTQEMINDICGTEHTESCEQKVRNVYRNTMNQCAYLYANINDLNIADLRISEEDKERLINLQKQSGKESFNKVGKLLDGCDINDENCGGNNKRLVPKNSYISKLVYKYIVDKDDEQYVDNECVNSSDCKYTITNDHAVDSWYRNEMRVYKSVPLEGGYLGRVDVYSNVISWWKVMLIILVFIFGIGGSTFMIKRIKN